ALSSTMVGAIGAIAEPGPEGAHSKPCAAGAGDAIEWVVITDVGADFAAAASRAVSSSCVCARGCAEVCGASPLAAAVALTVASGSATGGLVVGADVSVCFLSSDVIGSSLSDLSIGSAAAAFCVSVLADGVAAGASAGR